MHDLFDDVFDYDDEMAHDPVLAAQIAEDEKLDRQTKERK